jgi:hypothetical protein
MTLKVKYYQVYGNETFYPACETSELFAKLLKQKSLTRKNIEVIKKLGYTIEVKQELTTL